MNIDHTKKIDSYKLFTSLILLEANFSFYQASKVLHISQQKGLTSETNIVSYYLIRTQLWENLQLFLQFCKTSSTSSSTNKEILSLIFCAAVIVDKVPLSTSLLLDSAITNTDII